MIPIAHHAGEELILTAALGSGLPSATQLALRARLTQAVPRPRSS
jgi:hypothetical protein